MLIPRSSSNEILVLGSQWFVGLINPREAIDLAFINLKSLLTYFVTLF